MKGARLILNSRFFHIADGGEAISNYAVSKDYVKNFVEYLATRETVDFNIEEISKDLPAATRQKDTIRVLEEVLKDNGITAKENNEYKEYTETKTRTSAERLITQMIEEITVEANNGNITPDDNIQSVLSSAQEILNFYNPSSKRATDKQIKLIDELINSLPSSEEMPFEYEDFRKAPTQKNASALISRLSEEVMENGAFDKVANFVEYIAKRPSVYKVGEHGLFSGGSNIDLDEAVKEVSKHEGNIYSHVLSLRRQDAQKLGFEKQKPFRDLVLAHIDEIADAHNIKPENLIWYGAMHNTTYHPHMHLIVMSKDPKEGYFNKESIKNLKSKFAGDIFARERYELYINKDKALQSIQEEMKSSLNQLLKNPTDYISPKNQAVITDKMIRLSQEYKGSAKYGFQTQEVKQLVNDIERDIVNNNSKIKEMYKVWCDEKYKLDEYYVTKPQVPDITENQYFTPLKNIILNQAKEIRNNTAAFNTINAADNNIIDNINNKTDSSNDVVYKKAESDISINTYDDMASVSKAEPLNADTGKIKNYTSTTRTSTVNRKYSITKDYMKKFPDLIYYSDEPNNLNASSRKIYDDMNYIFKSDSPETQDFKTLRALAEDLNIRDGKTCRKLADCYNYGLGTQQDLASAVMWYGIAADEYKDGMSAYKLGQMYLHGNKAVEINEELGNFYCKQAFYIFRDEIENTKFFIGLDKNDKNLDYLTDVPSADAYKEYLMALMYMKGQGVEQDYFKAFNTFTLASENGYLHSDYYLGNMYYYGLGVQQDYIMAFNYYFKASEGKDSYADYRIAKMYLKGQGVEANIKKAAMYLMNAGEKIAMAKYDLASLFEHNQDMFNADSTQIYTLYRVALEELTEQDNDIHDAFTETRIANMYLFGKGTEINIDKAVEFLDKASKQNNPDASYQLAFIYSSDKYNLLDEDKANSYYKQAKDGYETAEKENENSTAEYRLGLIYLNGLGTETDINKAVEWLDKSAGNMNSSAAYKLAQIYEQGLENIQADFDKAVKYYQMSAELDNPYAHYKLGCINLERENMNEAVKNFEKAEEKNIAHASYKLGQIYTDEQCPLFDPQKSAEHFSKALSQYIEDYNANPDDFTSYRIGQMYFNSLGTKQNIEEAVSWFEKSAQQGNSDAFYQLGNIYSSDEYNFKDDEKAFNCYKQAKDGYETAEKENENSTAEYRLGVMYLNGLGTETDVNTAVEWFDKAVQNGNSYAAYQLGRIYYSDNFNLQDLQKAEKYFLIAAENDNPFAFYYLGNIYLTYNELDKSVKYFEKAEGGNIAHASYKLGQIYADEQSPLFNLQKSAEHFSKALSQYIEDYNANPDDFTSYRIGQMYFNSLGTKQNIEEAVSWFEKSAQQGNSDAFYQLGNIYSSDEFLMKNTEKANRYFNIALTKYLQEFRSNQGDPNLPYKIGTMYQYGLGVKSSINKAVEYYKRAVENGNMRAQQKIDEAAQTQKAAALSLATTMCHFGRILNTETMAVHKNNYVADKKALRREKLQKIYAGQAVEDYSRGYDY